MNFILFDDEHFYNYLPLTYTRPVSELIAGCYTIRGRWEYFLQSKTSTLSRDYLQHKYPLLMDDDNILINSRLIPGTEITDQITNLANGKKLIADGEILAVRLDGEELNRILDEAEKFNKYNRLNCLVKLDLSAEKCKYNFRMFRELWDLFEMTAALIEEDLKLLEENEFRNREPSGNTFTGERVFVHRNASLNASVLNSTTGPIVVDDGAVIMEHVSIRGPVYIGKNAVVKMGTRIYGPTSIGPGSKVGGEINSSVIFGNSNKAHDGFLGHSVIGEWCNLGADTNTSNLKNDYGNVKFWNYINGDYQDSSRQFLGMVMGDHSKCGINSMFNTGTSVGVGCNIYSSLFFPKFIPSYTWGRAGSFTTYRFEKMMETVYRVLERRKLKPETHDELILQQVFDESAELRKKFH